jgi:hypothetical protein
MIWKSGKVRGEIEVKLVKLKLSWCKGEVRLS